MNEISLDIPGKKRGSRVGMRRRAGKNWRYVRERFNSLDLTLGMYSINTDYLTFIGSACENRDKQNLKRVR